MHVPGRAGKEQAYLKSLVLHSLGTSYNQTARVRCADAMGTLTGRCPCANNDA